MSKCVKVEVTWTPQQLKEICCRKGEASVAVVIDVLRATTCMACAMFSGALKIITASSHDEARKMKLDYPDALLCGEKNNVRPADFDLGNSPSEFLSERVHGRVLIQSTTNGTKAVDAMIKAGVQKIYTGSFRQLTALTSVLKSELGALENGRLIIAASGTLDGASYEDLLFGGALLQGLGLSHPVTSLWRSAQDGRLHEILFMTRNGRALRRKGLEKDVLSAAEIDASPVVTSISENGFVVRGGKI